MKSLVRQVVFLLAIWLPIAALLLGCSSDSTPAQQQQQQTQAVLSSIAVAPKGAVVTRGATVQLTATGTYSDATVKDLTALVSFTSSDPAVAIVSNAAETRGLVTGVAKGVVTVTASLAVGDVVVSGGVSLSVTDAALRALSVSPATPSLAKGTQLRFMATGTFEDGATQDLTAVAAWSSSAVALAEVSDEGATKGLVTAFEAGKVTITAKVGDVTGSAALVVTSAVLTEISVYAPDPWVAKGMEVQFTAKGIFSDDTLQDLTEQAAWASSDPCVTVSDVDGKKGLAMAVAAGTATISATALGVTGTRDFQVTPATLESIDVTPKGASIAAGTTTPFVATGILSDHSFLDLTRYAVWSSSDETVVEVANFDAAMKGFATGIAAGTATVTAKYGNVSGVASVTITGATLDKVDIVPLNPVVPKGLRQWFLAIGTFSDGTAQNVTTSATWGTSDATVVSISNVPGLHGMAITIKEGIAVLTASVAGKSAATTLTVTAATLEALTVTPANPSIAKGTSVALTATGTYSDSTTRDLTAVVTWASSSTIATVSNATDHWGLVSGVAQGVATIKASLGGVTGKSIVTVTASSLASIEVTPTNVTIAKGTRVLLMATGTYSDQTTQDLTTVVTWSSSDASVAVSNDVLTHGLAFGLVEGSAVVTASFGGTSGATKVTVTAATLDTIDVTPENPSIADGTSVRLYATGTYSDNSKQDLTELASWTSSDPTIVYVSNAPYWRGVAYAVGQGTATVTVTYGATTASTTVTVTAAKLSEVVITPHAATIAKGTTQWFTATARYTDDTEQDVTTYATWASSDPTRVIISNAYASQGLATAVSEGTVTISAAYAGKVATTTLTVTAASLTGIVVLPANQVVNKETATQFQAIGTYSDNSSQVITTSVTWTSSNTAVAITSNAYGSKGLVTAVTAGTTNITAMHPASGKTGSTGLTVK